MTDESPLSIAREALRGERPAVRIEGDVQFTAEVNWLVDHVRWDAEEDLARLIGDAPAHTLASIGRGAPRSAAQVRGRRERPRPAPHATVPTKPVREVRRMS